MSEVNEGRGQWYREYLLKNFGKRALFEHDTQRVKQATLPPIDEYVAKGPEFEFDECYA